MSKRQPYTFADNAPDAPRYWSSIEDLEGQLSKSPEYEARVRQAVDAEFGEGDSYGPTDETSRRSFLGIMGASIGLATMAGCRRPVEHILPYARQPNDVNIGVPDQFTTVFVERGDAVGLLVESHTGRPTKIEGNPDHPGSGGAVSLRGQASVLDLYDPDRMRTPMEGSAAKTWEDFDRALDEMLAPHRGDGGTGLRFLVQPSVSPTFMALRAKVKQRFPSAKFYTYDACSTASVREGARLAFGQPVNVAYDFSKARTVLALDADFLGTEPGMVRHARGWSQRRKMQSAQDRDPSRLYVVEPSMTVTGGTADHRLRLPARDALAYLQALGARIARESRTNLAALASALGGDAPAGVPAHWVDAVAADLLAAGSEALIVVGSRQPAAVHALAHTINQGLGALHSTVKLYPVTDADEGDTLGDLAALAGEIGSVRTLIILGGNPVYNAPASLGLAEKIRGVQRSLHATLSHDETCGAVKWCAPLAHYLETWGDQKALDGTVSIQQPLIEPLYHGRSEIELLAQILGAGTRNGYELVRATFIDGHPWTVASEAKWRRALASGMVADSTAAPLGTLTARGAEVGAAVTAARPRAGAAPNAQRFEVVFAVDAKMHDGRGANNAWLQELPDPVTKITWDNAALISTKAARELSITNGDKIEVTVDGKKVAIVAWIAPGQADYVLTLPLGWGRTKAGRVGDGKGFDVNAVRSHEAFYFADATVRKTGERYPISQTQEHHRMSDRAIAVETTLAKYKEQPHFPAFRTPSPRTLPLWREAEYNGYKWGLVIDLTACTGCSACIVACQAENNIPAVGKEQVARGREMLWLRLDRYFVSPRISRDGFPSDEDVQLLDSEPLMAINPVACQQCEEAPCENVCPVNATVHSPEGLNDMAYNRCIGTRYCSNNCPYKVRRFNYLNFHNDSVYQPQDPDVPETVRMQHNPNVTVRFRGVMEKCTYCVQRIQTGKIRAKNEYRTLRDGEVQTACQQTCPTGAIVFGDLNNRDSRVRALQRTDRRYQLLAELGVQPRTMYLAKIRNPNPEMHG
jgi:Fe-S-cluster-containing dehydrogenase component/anaerobic selenocysteine-containing dehydrogenase